MIPVIDTLTTMGNYPVAKALDIEVNGNKRLDEVLNNKVDKLNGKSLSTNDYTNDDKIKLYGIENGATKTIVDNTLSNTSANPVQNKVISEALNNKSNSSTVLALSERVNQNESNIAIQTSRIDNIANLPEGSTSADAELIDIRVGSDNKTYTSSGNAVRSQINDVKINLKQMANSIGSIQYVDENSISENSYWESAGTTKSLSSWSSAPVILNLAAGTYFFCGVNPSFSWVVRRSDNNVTQLATLFSWTETDYYKKHSVTIPYDFDVYLSRQNNYTEVLKFASGDFTDTFNYEESLTKSIDKLINSESTGVKVYPLILTDDTIVSILPDANNAEDNTIYRIAISNIINNLPSDYSPDSYYLVTITNTWQSEYQKKQMLLTVNGGINVKWTRLFQEVWLPWQKIISNPLEEDTRTIINVGPNETYKNINSALNAITDNSENKKYKIIVKAGTYDVPNNELYFGIKNFVDIQGEDKTTVIVRNMYSNNSYDDSRSVFDPQLYNPSIKSAKISNMTIISRGCKCPIHIDGTAIANGGKILIDNCILMDLNTTSNYNYPNQRFTRIGGVNCGLGNGQTVEITNTISNGTLYAHNQSGSSTPSNFIIDHCTFRGTLIGCAYDINIKDNYIIRNSKLDYVAIQTLYATNNKYNIVMSDNTVNYIFAPDDDNITDPYGTFDLMFDGKCGVTDTSCHKLMFNTQPTELKRGDIVYFVTDQYNKGYMSDYFIGSEGTNFAGIAMENIPSGSVGWVQYAGKISVPKINGAKYGDLIDFSNGNFVSHQTGNTPIAKYAESSPLYANQNMICLIN